MLIALLALFAVTDARSVLYGAWAGESICTNVRPACHNEHAVYHIASSEKPEMVVMTMNKVVDAFTRSGTRMQGTAKQLPNGEVIRNIRLEKR
jgi:hypothetical protein